MSSLHLKKKNFSNSLMISAESSVLALVLASNMEDFKIISRKPRDEVLSTLYLVIIHLHMDIQVHS